MKKNIYLITAGLLVLAASGARAQMKIGGSGAPDPSAMLEVTGGPSNNKGFLVPRISLSNVSTWGLSGATPVAGMVVYNTNASVTGGSGVGIYFWNGTQWVKAANSPDWSLNGNSGTNPATQFIGTTDNQPLVLRTNNAEAMRVAANGNVGIGTTDPNSLLSITPNADGAKITLWDGGIDTAHYGFGITGTFLNYHVVSSTAAHRFFAGGKNGNGTELMRVQGNGNVGVGTTAPAYKVHIAGNSQVAATVENTGSVNSDYAAFRAIIDNGGSPIQTSVFSTVLSGNTNGGVGGLQTNTANDLVFRTGQTAGNPVERMRIDTAGNVGIGTNDPKSLLSITPNADGAKITLWDGGVDTAHYGFGITGTYLNYHVVNSTAAHRFFAGGKNGNGTELMRIQGNGNVGIGVTAPTAQLHLSGVARIVGSAGTPTTIMGRDADGNVGNVTLGAGLTLAGGVLTAPATATGWGLVGNTGTNPATNFIGTSDNQPLVLRTNNAEAMRVAANGNVGIGTTAPGYELHVSGNNQVNATVQNTGSANNDYSAFRAIMNGPTPIQTTVFSTVQTGSTNDGVGGLQTNTAHDLVFRTGVTAGNPVERVRIDTAGNVGIGTNDPNSSLSITPNADGAKITLWDGGVDTTHYGFGITGTYLNYHVVNSTAAHRFFAGGKNGNGTELMRVQGNGNVGVGTTAPAYKVHIAGNSQVAATVENTGSVNSDYAAFRTIIDNGGSPIQTSVFSTVLSGNTNGGVGGLQTSTANDLVFRTGQTAGNPVERMRIDTAGNVGIGTNDPKSLLSITPNADGAKITLWDGGVDTAHYGFGITGTYLNYHVVNSTAAHRFFAGGKNGNGTELMRIQGNGRVGIGTTAPAFDLHVSKADYGAFNGFAVSDNAGANASTFTITPGYFGTVSGFGVTLDVTGISSIGFSDPIIPAANGSFSCGTSAFRWSEVYALNGTINTSDAREKENVRNLGLGLDAVMKLRPVMYDWKEGRGKDKIGFIAQELRKVVPNVVVGDESKETLGVYYSDMVPVLTKAIQEQQAQIEELKMQNAKAKSENEQLAAAMNEMKAKETAYADLAERMKQMEQMLGVKTKTSGTKTVKK